MEPYSLKVGDITYMSELTPTSICRFKVWIPKLVWGFNSTNNLRRIQVNNCSVSCGLIEMISRELESRTKKTKDFAELWMKFRDMYIEATKKEVITPEEEKSFLETKSLIARKYQVLVDTLKLKPTEEDRTLDVVSGVLSLKSLSTLSDMQTRKIESDWQSSYILLNKILGHLESEKESLAKVSRIKIIMGRLIKSRLFKFLLILLFTITVFYVARWLRLAEKLWSRFGLGQNLGQDSISARTNKEVK